MVLRQFAPRTCLNYVEKYGITFLIGAPPMLKMLHDFQIKNQRDLSRTGSTRISPHFMPRILAAAQIAIAHGLRGPSLTVSTACSSGADAAGTAFMLLQRGEADVMVAVGAESIICPLMDYMPNQPRRTNVRVAMSNSFGFGGQLLPGGA